MLRGARQVGKTWLVRDLAKRQARQLVELNLRCLPRAFEDPRLFYWQRTGGRQGKIDYIVQHGSHTIPVEVKPESAGAMKSLHAFMHTKQLILAVRLDANPPSVQQLDVRTTTSEQIKYTLLSLPLYMVESLPDGIERCRKRPSLHRA